MIETRNVYIQLLELCQQQLAAGKWAVGERFPSERELAAEYGISRATANKVLAKLSSEGWLEIRRGAGAFVAERPTLFSELRQMDSFTEFAEANHLAPSTQVTSFGLVDNAEPVILNELGLSDRSKLLCVERLRLLGGVVVIHETRWLPARLYPRIEAADLKQSFYALCRERYKLVIDREDATVRAALPPVGSGLGSQPSLQVTGTGYDAEGQALWRQQLHYRGECFELHHSAETMASFPRLSLRISPFFIDQLKSKS